MDKINGYDVGGERTIRLVSFIAPGNERDDKGSRRNEVTVEEAGRLACVGPVGCGTTMVSDPSLPDRVCLGDRCMAWRFGAPLIEKTVNMEVDMLAMRVRKLTGSEEIPVPERPLLQDCQPEGEGWTVRDAGNGYNVQYVWYERICARQGYCAFVKGS